MEETKNFSDTLFAAILERQQQFDSIFLPKMLEEYRICQSAAKTLLTVFLKKGIFHDDPYKYDSKITDIQIPSDDPFTDSDRAGMVGRRLSQYESMLDYMGNYYQFTCDFLTTDRINKLVAFNKCFMWEAFSTTSSKPNTKGLADLATTIRNGNDPLSISIVNDSLNQLAKSSAAITKTLKNLTDFHRERYKAAVRRLVMPSVHIREESLSAGTGEAVREIKKSFAVNMKDYPFYTELIAEIVNEEFSSEKERLRAEVLARIAGGKPETSKAVQVDSLKTTLLNGVRTLGGVSPQLDQIAKKLQENQAAVASTEKGFMQKLAMIFRKAFNLPEETHEIIINSVDPVTQAAKRDSIDFIPFIEDLRRRSRVYTGFTVKTSPAWLKIESMQESQILDLLTRYVAELNGLLKQCAGLDDYFKQNAQVEIRDHIHGIKVEISAIRNTLVKANQYRAEYTSQIEEQQQLRKLGITNA
jgi:hypothetical protein